MSGAATGDRLNPVPAGGFAHRIEAWTLPVPRKLHGLPPLVLRGGLPRKRVPVLIIGMSHARALVEALQGRATSPTKVILFAQAEMAPTASRRARINPALFARFRPGLAVSAIGGNQHNILGILEHPEPFDFEDPAVPGLLPGRRIIPRREMRAQMRTRLALDLPLIQALHETYGGPTVHLAAPPPVREERFLKAFMNRKQGAAYGAPSVRLKLYNLQNEVLSAFCAEHGITFLPAPDEAFGVDGFLNKAFARGDPSHANRAYGERVVAAVEAIARHHGVV